MLPTRRRIRSLSIVPTTGTSDKHLSVVFATSWERCTCTTIGHLPVSHQPSVDVTQVKGTSSVCLVFGKWHTAVLPSAHSDRQGVQTEADTCLLGRYNLVRSHDSFILDKKTSGTCLCVWTISTIRYALHILAKYTSRGNAVTTTRQTFGNVSKHEFLSNKPVVETVRQLFAWFTVKQTITDISMKYKYTSRVTQLDTRAVLCLDS